MLRQLKKKIDAMKSGATPEVSTLAYANEITRFIFPPQKWLLHPFFFSQKTNSPPIFSKKSIHPVFSRKKSSSPADDDGP